MRRREFITGLGGAAAVGWPVSVPAQQTGMPTIGILRSTGADGFAHLVTAFRKGLLEAGYIEGRNVVVDFRYADGQPDRLPALVADLIERKAAVIVGNTPAALAAKAATTTVPIVFSTGSDPVRDGLVASLNRPGGNVTGVVFFSGVLAAKRLELLRLLAPKATTLAVLMNPSTREGQEERRDVEVAAKAIGLQYVVFDATNERDFELAFTTFVQRGAGALIVGSGGFLNANRKSIIALAARHGLPASFSLREFAVDGGLMSYGASQTDAYRKAGTYAGRILQGEKPADLPVLQPTVFEFIINLKAAKALDIEVPDRLIALADEVIE
jgi:putative tryptophan/tyrosine transport system substrate-binding protein